MRLSARLKRDWRFFRGLMRTLKRVRSIAPDSPNLICDDLQEAAGRWSTRPAMSFEGRTVTYGELDQMANRYAHWARSLNLRRGQTVALFMPNRLEYFAVWYGLSKVGVVTALINHQLTGQPLAHCLDISGASHVIVDEETSPVFEAARALVERQLQQWTHGPASHEQRDLIQALKSCSQLPPDRSLRSEMTARDTALLIYTSGTTGLPKAARVTHSRVQLYMRGFAGATDARETDRIYIALPLYHATGGLCGVGSALLNGGMVILKKRFSASQFWDDIVAQEATMFVYIGELCRYLVNQPEHPEEHRHKLRLAFGNGLRGEVWSEMVRRFRIPDVLEFYGSTEGNVSTFNFDAKIGSIGRIPKWARKKVNLRLVQFDTDAEQPVRNPQGLCIECGPGQVGECLGKIGSDPRFDYSGYVDKVASERKILRDVVEKGDAWFRTGDLMRMDAEGFLYFVDRIGDTFRWKGENVSTGEVAGQLEAAPGVAEANVYGVEVPHTDGRAGMAALVVEPGFDIKAFGDYVAGNIAAYAQPVFVRILPVIETTGTFKYRKVDLVDEGFDPARIKGPLYWKNPAKGYQKITKASFEKLQSGGVKL